MVFGHLRFFFLELLVFAVLFVHMLKLFQRKIILSFPLAFRTSQVETHVVLKPWLVSFGPKSPVFSVLLLGSAPFGSSWLIRAAHDVRRHLLDVGHAEPEPLVGGGYDPRSHFECMIWFQGHF